MDTKAKGHLGVVSLHRFVMAVLAGIPYRLSPTGHSLPPWHYYFEMTRRCNLRCRMCQYRDWLHGTDVAEQSDGELTTDEWKRVLDQLHWYNMVTFTGGEPFMRGDFLELLAYASARARTHFISNGILIDEACARRCVELAPAKMGGRGLNMIGISVEGPQEVHDAIRAVRGGFKKTTDAIRAITRLRDEAGKRCPVIHVSSVVQAASVDTLHEMPAIVAEAGADVLNLTIEVRNFLMEGIGDTPVEQYAASDVEFPPAIEPHRLADALARTREAAERAGVELRVPDMADASIEAYFGGKMNLGDFMCRSIWTSLIVGYNGDAYPCWFKRVGSVRTQTLRQIWNSPAIRAFRVKARKRLFAPCAGCCFLIQKPAARGAGSDKGVKP